MDTLAGVGSAEAGNPNSGNAAEQSSGSEAQAANNAGQETGNLDWAKAKGWVNEDGSWKQEDVLKGYQSLEKRIGTMVAVPDEKAAPEARDEFHKKLGWPGDEKGYEFKKPEGLPENFVYDENTANWFKSIANEARLPKGTAQVLHDKYVEHTAAQVAAFEQEIVGKAKVATEAITKDWGDPKSETYIKNNDAAVRALRTAPELKGLEQELKESGLLTRDGAYTSPALANLLSGYGKQMQNDTLIGNALGGASANPFQKDGPGFNLTTQAQLIKSEPQKARALAQAAGWDAEKIAAYFPT